MGLFSSSKSKSKTYSTTNTTVDNSNTAATEGAAAVKGHGNVTTIQDFDPVMFKEFMDLTGDGLSNNLVAHQLNLEAGLKSLGYANSAIESAMEVARESSQESSQNMKDVIATMSRPVGPAVDYTQVLMIGGGLALVMVFLKGKK